MRLLLCVFLLCFVFSLRAQITGVVSDPTGEPVAFANIYVQNTSRGTVSNAEGFFELELEPGTYTLVFSRIGYRQHIETVEAGAAAVKLRIVLEPQAIDLSEVEVTGDAEDPAYAIIRKAMEKRTYYRDRIPLYQCSVYIKGRIELLETPEQVLGQDVGDLDGLLDTTGQGILYLSESESVLFFRAPDDFKEEMISSKVSGDNNMFSFNSAMDLDFSLYRNYSTFPRQIISPIAPGAFSYYRYRLESSTYDEEGRLINKIALLPKREEDPVYHGYIYIVEDLWNLSSVDVYLTGESMNEPIFDTVFITQQFVPVDGPDGWALFSQNFGFRGGLMGFAFSGQFVGVYSDYEVEPELPERFFGPEVFRVEEGANEVGEEYFAEVRPIPLTEREAIDYARKDSIFTVRNSREWRDSVDQVNNKFETTDILTGYGWQNSFRGTNWQISSPLNGIQYNTVQGLVGRLEAAFRKTDDDTGRFWEAGSEVVYGFGDDRWLNRYFFNYRFNRIHNTRLELGGGSRVRQFNPENPITPTNNGFYTFYFKRNYLKLLREGFLEGRFSGELVNGLWGELGVSWSERAALTNSEDYSLIKWEERDFTSNNPLNPASDAPAFADNRALTTRLTLRFRPGQKYLTYPNRRIVLGSDWPVFTFTWHKGIPAGNVSEVNYDRLSLEIREPDLPLGLVGELSWRVEAGWFPNKQALLFADFQHFLGNQTVFGNPSDYLRRFQLLPYYEFSTTDPWLQAQLQHHFNGFLIDRIPLLRKSGIHTVIGGAVLQQWPTSGDFAPWWEVSLGFDDLGWGVFRIFRLDGVVAFRGASYQNWGIVLGIKLPPLN